jgi:cyclopropane fatty-acyl-phospholipid synthase-like methyltransferase
VTPGPDRELDAEALAFFARKGFEGGPGVPQAGEQNGEKVRRILQLIRDFAGDPARLRVLDLGCGDGVYAIEAALHGAEVRAVDARRQRMDVGAAHARRHGLDRVRFELGDVRHVRAATHGRFDVVLALGILYHLDVDDLFAVLANLRGLCGDAGLCLIDTFVSLAPDLRIERGGASYEGQRLREHGDGDPPEVRRERVLRSIDNAFSLRLTLPSLVRALEAAGFSSVLQCHAPLEPSKPAERVTLMARAGERVRIGTYPSINERRRAGPG